MLDILLNPEEDDSPDKFQREAPVKGKLYRPFGGVVGEQLRGKVGDSTRHRIHPGMCFGTSNIDKVPPIEEGGHRIFDSLPHSGDRLMDE